MPDGFDGGGGPTDLNVCRVLTTEEIEQQLARKSDDTNRGSPVPGSDDMVRPRPLELEPSAAEPPREEPGCATDVAPQSRILRGRVRPRTITVGSAHILMVDEELVERGKAPHPTDSEETSRRSRTERCNQPGKLPTGERPSTSFGESGPSAGNDEPWCREGVVLAQHQVRNEITRRPRLAEGRRVGGEFIEQVGELRTLDDVEPRTGHSAKA